MNVTQRAIEAAGGNLAVANKIGVTMPTVWRYGQNNRFKGRYVQALCAMTSGAFSPAQVRPDVFGGSNDQKV
jgi:DNA-binding transcriptional regulator YdaS (Cro superfamily)